MRTVQANGVELAYERHGERDGVPLVLICGLGMQLVGWHDDLVGAMVRRGYQVVRFDNRDSGGSTDLSSAGVPDLREIVAGTAVAPYGVADLAADAAGLIEGLGWESAHVLGLSMGGMIAQSLALTAPERVRSLISVSSDTGDREIARPTTTAGSMVLNPAATTREQYIERAEQMFTLIGSVQFPVDAPWIRRRAALSWDRGHNPAGVLRQAAAILSAPDRTAALAGLQVPSLVVHGSADPLVPVAAGRLAAAVIPTAELLEIEGMGHDLPRAVWERILDKVDDVVHRGEMATARRAAIA
ncbi:MAG: alpha/beta fold hydrolase [Frankia sp.]